MLGWRRKRRPGRVPPARNAEWEPTYRHRELGFEVTPAGGWSLLEEAPTHAMLAVAGPDVPRPAVMTIALHPVQAGWDVDAFLDEGLHTYAHVAEGSRLIEREPARIAGLPAGRVLLEYRSDQGVPTMLEEWRLLEGPRGWMISAHCPVIAYAPQVQVIRATAESLVLPDAGEASLTVSADELTALTRLFGGGRPDPEPLAALRAAGIVDGDAPRPSVARMLAVIAGAELKLTVQHEDTTPAVGFLSGSEVVLMRIGADDRRELTMFDLASLPSALEQLLDVGPRPTEPDRPTLRTTVAELREAFAGAGDPAATTTTTTVEAVVRRRRDYWRLDAELSDPDDDDAFLAAIDGPGGWWLVRPEGDEVLLVPTTDATLRALLGVLAGGEPPAT